MKTINTNWTTPKRNMLVAMFDLRKALAYGENARLIKMRNEDCTYPIKIKNNFTDFRAYEFSVGLLQTRNSIANDTRRTEFQKYLSLNYNSCFGTQEAVDTYYKTGLLSKDNFKGMGVSHLVAVKDFIAFHASLSDQKDKDRAEMFKQQYFDENTADEKHFFDNFRLKSEHSIYTISNFKRKVWVVELLEKNKKVKIPFLIKVLNIILYPLRYIPSKSVLRMPEYKTVTFSIGSVIHGFNIEFQIPKKFSFK